MKDSIFQGVISEWIKRQDIVLNLGLKKPDTSVSGFHLVPHQSNVEPVYW